MLNTNPDPDKISSLGSNDVTNGMGGNAIVRVESAAGEGLDELFKAVMNGNHGQSRLPQQVPMRQRRLPPSFFRPPSAASSTNSVNHSRESSLDGGYQSGQTPVSSSNKMDDTPVMGYTATGLAIIHPRANSSPAALQPAVPVSAVNGQALDPIGLGKSSNAPTVNGNGIAHFRQMSYDLEQIRLPQGWEMSYTATGERYFLNHKDKTTTWEDPRKKELEEMLRRNNIQSPQQQPIIHQQPPPPMPQSQPQPNQVVPNQDNLPNVDPSTVPLPEGWEQARTPSGDIYFISHVDQSTTWFHPSIPRDLQMKRVQQHQQQNCSAQPPPFQTNSNIPQLVAALKNMNTSCQTPTANTNMSLEQALKPPQNQHLRDLELERERMRQRQEEILQNSLLSSNASNLLLSSSTEPNHSPFMLQNECHSRQESSDSGLDLGNSSNYSMPHTPDDFLRLSAGNAGTGNGTNGVNTTAPATNGNGGISDNLAFDSMLSGLDLETESMDFMQGLDMDLLSNVEELLNTNKDNIMTWL